MPFRKLINHVYFKSFKVVNQTGEELGEVVTTILNPTSGQTEFILFRFGGYSNLPEKLIPLPWLDAELDLDTRQIVADLNPATLEKVEGMDPEKVPDIFEGEELLAQYQNYGLLSED